MTSVSVSRQYSGVLKGSLLVCFTFRLKEELDAAYVIHTTVSAT